MNANNVVKVGELAVLTVAVIAATSLTLAFNWWWMAPAAVVSAWMLASRA